MLIYGAGGHAKVVISAAASQEVPVSGVFDDAPSRTTVGGVPVVGHYDPLYLPDELLVVAVGDNRVRREIVQGLKHAFATLQHVSAMVDPSATLGDGTVVLHGAIVQAEARLGRHCIVNTRATIDHDCRVDDFAHVAPGATLCGEVHVGAGCLIGANATLLPGVSVGDGATVGAGSVVTRAVPPRVVAAGVPCRVLRPM